MSSHLGFRRKLLIVGPTGTQVETPMANYTYQPPCHGNMGPAKPTVEDSAIVTVNVMPRLTNGVEAFPGGSTLVDAFLHVVWNAAKEGQLEAFMDLMPGVSFSVAATSVQVSAFARWSVDVPFASFEVDSTIGRMPHTNGDFSQPTRTIAVGNLNAAATSAAFPIPPFARNARLISDVAANQTGEIIFLSNGVVVQTTSNGQVPVINVNYRADSFQVKNNSIGAANFAVVFGIGL